jgi:predicted metalloprotease with PDZ domain
VPHGLSLSGEYDWFYEGWTLYQAMRVGMTLGYLNFQDYLNALGRAFDGYHALKSHTQLSLIDLSKRRWTSGQGLIYNKGMLSAFIFDLTLRQRTRGKQSVDNIYRELFDGYSSKNDSANGNDVIIKLLNRRLGSGDFTKLHIESPTDVDLPSALQAFGLEVRQTGARTRIHVTKSLTRQQHDLLRGLGYNARVVTVTWKNRGNSGKKLLKQIEAV